MSLWLGARIETLTNVKLNDDASVSEKTAMVRAARQLLSAITKVLILADRIVIKQLITAKDQVHLHCSVMDVSRCANESSLTCRTDWSWSSTGFQWKLHCSDTILAYLSNIVRTVTAACSCSGLISTSSSNFALPQLRSWFSERSFSRAGPSAWNALPSDIRAVRDMKAFRQAVNNSLF